jgi:hypothetical protein
VVTGKTVLDGVPVTVLTATHLNGLPTVNSPNIWPTGTVSALSVWVDANGVVRQLAATATQIVRVAMGPRTPAQQRLFRAALARIARQLRDGHLNQPTLQEIRASKLSRLLRAEGVLEVRSEADTTTMTIRFLDIGQPQLITVPAHAIPTYGLG